MLRDEGHEPFHDDDLDVLVEMAERAAPVIRNAQIVADQRRRDAAMAEFARGALASDNPAGLHQSAVDLLREALGAAYVVYLEADGEERLLVTAARRPARAAVPAAPRARVTAPKPLDVLRTGDPYVCDDMHHEVSAEMVALAETLGADSGLAVRVRGSWRRSACSPSWPSAPAGSPTTTSATSRPTRGCSRPRCNASRPSRRSARWPRSAGGCSTGWSPPRRTSAPGSPTACTRTRCR